MTRYFWHHFESFGLGNGVKSGGGGGGGGAFLVILCGLSTLSVLATGAESLSSSCSKAFLVSKLMTSLLRPL